MICVVASITDPKQFLFRLGHALVHQNTGFDLKLTDPNKTLPESYNSIGDVLNFKYIMFAHQDVWFPQDFLQRLERLAERLPDFGCGGVTGWKLGNKKMFGGIWRTRPRFKAFNDKKKTKVKGIYFPYSLSLHGKVPKEPIEVGVLDDMIFLVNGELWRKRKFDNIFKFHGTSEDYCFQAMEEGYKNYVLPIDISSIPTGSAGIKAHGSTSWARVMLRAKWSAKYGDFSTCIGYVRK